MGKIKSEIRGYVSGVINDGKRFVLPWSGRGVNYTDDDIKVVVEAMKNADPLTQGSYQFEFEKIFSEYHENFPAFAVSSGAGALEISAELINIKPGDEVIIPAHTYIASAIPFARRGAKLVWADIDMDTRVVTAETIASKITSKTKAIVPVHLYGLCVEMEEVMNLADKNKIYVIEDCAQSLGSSYKGKKCGTFGHIAIYSFHAQKNISTLGEGGMIITNVPDFVEKIPGLRHNGHRAYPDARQYYWRPAMVNVDFDIENVWPHNFSIGEIQCAVGINLMKRLDKINERRYKKAQYVIEGLADCFELKFQQIPLNSTLVYSNLCAMYENNKEELNRNDLIRILSEEFKIQPVVQNNPLYRYPLMIKAGFGKADCPNTDKFFDNMLSLPFYEWFTKEQLDYLISSTKNAVERLR
jgi:perosamine synthetase